MRLQDTICQMQEQYQAYDAALQAKSTSSARPTPSSAPLMGTTAVQATQSNTSFDSLSAALCTCTSSPHCVSSGETDFGFPSASHRSCNDSTGSSNGCPDPTCQTDSSSSKSIFGGCFINSRSTVPDLSPATRPAPHNPNCMPFGLRRYGTKPSHDGRATVIPAQSPHFVS